MTKAGTTWEQSEWKRLSAEQQFDVIMKRKLTQTLVLALSLVTYARAEPLLIHTDVFVSGKDGYHTYRIPAIEAAPDGSLIAFAEARKYNADDPGFGKQDIDLVCKRSLDKGATWSSMVVIEDP